MRTPAHTSEARRAERLSSNVFFLCESRYISPPVVIHNMWRGMGDTTGLSAHPLFFVFFEARCSPADPQASPHGARLFKVSTPGAPMLLRFELRLCCQD